MKAHDVRQGAGFIACAYLLLALAGTTNSALAQERLRFRPESPAFLTATTEYDTLWRDYGRRIVCLLEAETGVSLRERVIDVIVLDGMSRSGLGARPMFLRASYPMSVKQGTLVHELAHRYLDALRLPPGSLRTHQQLDLLLLRVWPQLWGEAFVGSQVAAESQWTRKYRRSWEWALKLSATERDAHWRALLGSRRSDGEPRTPRWCTDTAR